MSSATAVWIDRAWHAANASVYARENATHIDRYTYSLLIFPTIGDSGRNLEFCVGKQ